MYIEKMMIEEKEELLKLCHDHKIFQQTESEAKKEKEKTKEKIRKILDKYGYDAMEKLDIYSIEYKAYMKPQLDTESLKACGLYEKFTILKEQKPLTIR